MPEKPASYVRKIMNDRKQYEKNNLPETEQIYCKFDEEDITYVKAMIVGPKDSAYEGGFYFIYVTFPKEYPYKSPQAKYCTQYQNFRFHPNLYTNGKMCLSILDRQWAGPPWTPAMQLATLLQTTKSILDNNPLANEPGYQKGNPENSDKHRQYRHAVRYMNIIGATINCIKSPPAGFDEFIPDMKKYFIEHFDTYMKFVDDHFLPLNGKTIGTQSYAQHPIEVNHLYLKEKIVETLDYCKRK